jgi:predicted TIM-barrel fold metal-dependent hydrolase
VGNDVAARAATSSRIDVHHHIAPPRHATELMARQIGPRYLLDWSAAKSLEDMDRAGIAAAVTSITEPGVRLDDDAAARALARNCNEYGARLAIDHPGRFGFFASLPLPNIDDSLREIEYALDVLGAQGIFLFTSYDGKYLGDPAFEPIMAELDRRQAVVLTHPRRIDCLQGIIPDVSASIIEFGAEISRAAARLLFTGSVARHPRIRFILPHAGGAVPFLMERFLQVMTRPEIAARLPRGLDHEIGKFFYDIAQATHVAAIASLLQVAPLSQLLFGSDFPFRTAAEHVDGLARCSLLDAGAIAAISRSNALRLMPGLGRAPSPRA